METELLKSVSATLQYFKLFSQPLTREELYRFLWQPPPVSYEQFCSYLNQWPEHWEKNPAIPGASGFWGWLDQSAVISRQTQAVSLEAHLKMARRAARLISWIPFLRAIMVGNSVGQETATAKSDIDFLIITSPGRIWFVRFFTHLILRFFRLRSFGDDSAGKICLSFYLDINHLNLAPYRVVEEDVYLAYWIHQLIGIHDPEGWQEKCITSNLWTKAYLPHCFLDAPLNAVYTRVTSNGPLCRWVKCTLEQALSGRWGDGLDRLLARLQWRKIPAAIKKQAEIRDNHVVLADGVLKFHSEDARRGIYQAWTKKNIC